MTLAKVVEHSADRPPSRLVTTRRLMVLVAVLAAVLVTLAAVSATKDWWFLNSGSSPTPSHGPNVVMQGEWNGHPWQLSAWRSESHSARFPFTPDGLCLSVTPRGFPGEGEGGDTSCVGSFAGIESMAETKTSSEMTITFLGGTASKQLPAYIAGPVISKATAVEVRFGNGDVLRVPTFAAPRGRLRRVRFYATSLPANVQPTPNDPTWLKSVAGLDGNKNVVACLVPATAMDGSSPLSDCR
jgi:hypothetical protein